MDKKTIATIATIMGVVGAGVFYGGVKYGINENASNGQKGNFAGRQMMQGGQNLQGQRTVGSNRQGMNGSDGGFSGGEIIAKDDQSITIKTRDGGSKIVYFSDATSIGKETSGASSDLMTGQQVMINGKANADGSISAQNIQIRTTQKQSE